MNCTYVLLLGTHEPLYAMECVYPPSMKEIGSGQVLCLVELTWNDPIASYGGHSLLCSSGAGPGIEGGRGRSEICAHAKTSPLAMPTLVY